jgi:hypothetical protein
LLLRGLDGVSALGICLDRRWVVGQILMALGVNWDDWITR